MLGFHQRSVAYAEYFLVLLFGAPVLSIRYAEPGSSGGRMFDCCRIPSDDRSEKTRVSASVIGMSTLALSKHSRGHDHS